ELTEAEEEHPPSFWTIALILLLPIILIVAGSLVEQSVGSGIAEGLSKKVRGEELAALMKAAPAWHGGRVDEERGIYRRNFGEK
ncbi:hypothetical protein N9908_05310, partial [Akkermansiaceae bacterium]|nr:hypothetical protein [Akkermansiaceae bacterium]